MQITISFVENIGEIYNQKPCNDGYKWFVENFPNGAEHEDVFQKAIDDGVISYCTWALAHSMPREKNVEWAIWCAEQVLSVFEEKYPDDDRPRKAIEAAKAWLKNPCDETRAAAARAAARAAWAARAAARGATRSAWAAWAAESAANVAAAECAACAADANPDLVMKILQKGFEIWRRK